MQMYKQSCLLSACMLSWTGFSVAWAAEEQRELPSMWPVSLLACRQFPLLSVCLSLSGLVSFGLHFYDVGRYITVAVR